MIVAGAGRAALGGRRPGGSSPRPARRRLLVPAQPDRRRQPAARRSSSLGPISLPHPERLQDGRPDFSIVHYATDTGVWRDYFAPGLHQAFGALWPLVVARRARRRRCWPSAGAATASCAGSARVALFGMLAYLFTPLSAAGAEGAPVGFGINIRYVHPGPARRRSPCCRSPRLARRPAAPVGAARRPCSSCSSSPTAPTPSCAIPLALFGFGLVVARWSLVPGGAAAALAGARGARAAASSPAASPPSPSPSSRSATRCSATTSATASRNDGRRRTDPRHATSTPPTAGPADVEDARIGLAGTTAGFPGYGFYGTDLSNRVVYLGEEGPHGAFNAIPTCAAFRAAVNDADLDYLVTSPFLNFIHPSDPVASPEARWLRGEPAVDADRAQRPGHGLEGRRAPRPRRPAAPPTRRCATDPAARPAPDAG